MEQTRVVRTLRIAWTAWWGVACVLVIMLWTRSYWFYDRTCIHVVDEAFVEIVSQYGRFIVSDGKSRPLQPRRITHQSHRIVTDVPVARDFHGRPLYEGIGFKRVYWRDGTGVVLPFGFVVVASLLAAAAPWIHWRRQFRLRALLIATTFIAAVLGLAVFLRG